MRIQDLLKILREFPEGAEVLLAADGELVPLTAEHVGVLDGKIVLAPVAAEPEVEAPKRKKAK